MKCDITWERKRVAIRGKWKVCFEARECRSSDEIHHFNHQVKQGESPVSADKYWHNVRIVSLYRRGSGRWLAVNRFR